MKIEEAPQSVLKRITRNVATLVSGTAAAGLIGMLTLVVNARALSPADLGILALIQTYAITFNGLLTFNTQLPLMKYGVQAIENGDHSTFSDLVWIGFGLDIAAGIAAAATAYLCLPMAISLFI